MSGLAPNHAPQVGLSTEELGSLRLLLRDDLVFSLQSFAGETCYVIEDPVHSTYFCIGSAEYIFVSLLNGKNTVADAVAKAAIALGSNALSEQEVSTICRWLTDNHLAGTQQSEHGRRFSEVQKKSAAGRWKKLLSPLSLSMNLGNPTSVLRALLPLFGWLYQPIGWLVWTSILCMGFICLLADWHGVASDSIPVVAPQNWLWLGLVWIGLKLIHECSHGLCCLKHGGTVRVSGINAVLFIPMPFVDASSAWKMPSKWQRMHVAFAGIYAELLLAALAVILRSYSDSEVLRMLCLQVMLTGGLMTLLFNLNPLMRFDGYYIFADWLEFPNLSQVSNRLVVQAMKRVLFGVRFPVTEHSRCRVLLLATYGVVAGVWRILVSASLIFAAERLFHGAGLPLALLAGAAWILVPLARGLQYVVSRNLSERPSRIRFASICLATFATFYFAGRSVLWPEELVLTAIADYVPSETVRCTVPGFVSSVHVQPGQFVNEGDVLLELSNPEFDAEVAGLRLQIARSQARRQYFQGSGDVASRQSEDASLTSLQENLIEKLQQQKELTVRATGLGVVIGDDLANLPNQFLAKGDAICIIGNASEKQIRIVVAQDDIEPLLEHQGQTVTVRFRGSASESITGTLGDIEPRASTQLIHPALATTAGGPLAVHAMPVTESNQQPTWELTHPSFVGTVEIPETIRNRCGAGQLATVHLHVSRETVAERIASNISDWIDSKRGARN